MSGAVEYTNHVLAAIGSALHDDDLGPDAMRWAPTPPQRRETHPKPLLQVQRTATGMMCWNAAGDRRHIKHAQWDRMVRDELRRHGIDPTARTTR